MISPEKQEALEHFLLKVTVPIFCKNPNNVDHIATGTLFEVNGKYYLVTARHIFDDPQARDFAIPTSPNDTEMRRLGHFVLHKWSAEEIDVAVLELQEDATIDAVQKGWMVLNPRHAAIASPQGVFLLCGYPSGFMTVSGQCAGGKLFKGYTARLNEIPQDAKRPVDDRLDLFFHHATEVHGSPIFSPHLRGTSGSSVWEYFELAGQSVWTPESSLRIIGIQSSFMNNKFIRAKSWEFVMAILRELSQPTEPARGEPSN